MEDVTVYSPEGFCQKCLVTKSALKKDGIPFTERTAFDADIDRFREEGHSSFPVVVIDGVPAWSDLRLDEVKKLKKLADSRR